MRYRIWLLVLMVSVVLACKKEGEAPPPGRNPAAALPATSYKLKITFEGLVGYLNTDKLVWALLPKASADTLPAGVDATNTTDFMEFPEHYAFLKVNGVNVKDSGVTKDLLIPIDGKEIEIPGTSTSTDGLPPDQFKQAASDKRDMLDPLVLTSKTYPQLAARIKLPLIAKGDWIIEVKEADGSIPDFVNVDPVKVGSFCVSPTQEDVVDPRVQAVTWQKEMTGDVTLKIQSIGGIRLPPLVLRSDGGKDIQISIVNQEWEALYDPKHVGHHLPAYRWFYNLSDSGVKSDCSKHYYPQSEAGGNRCPQKLYSE